MNKEMRIKIQNSKMMNKKNKVKLLTAIRAGSLPLSALKVVPGIYKVTDKGLYKHENGDELEYNQIIRLNESGCFGIVCMFSDTNTLPDMIHINQGYEGQPGEQTEITMITPEGAKPLYPFWK
jgi:hypothetical protein